MDLARWEEIEQTPKTKTWKKKKTETAPRSLREPVDHDHLEKKT